ncbi:DUF1566 domain-containing protein [Vibrio sp. JC009]|uniref:Lcl C-terminal domain-containing protein n=1 Tax=Vibrio sp. JC009 TaxID=2912314 RepID=UPI0023B0565B|nr:DUF1566 domain-containing protein [Vibrio sp. JC009]WED23126.1 DUF1566 domain-containing protein [Vibrio sp. JC009]
MKKLWVLVSIVLLAFVNSGHASEKMIKHFITDSGVAKDLKTSLMWMRCSLGQNYEESLFGESYCTGSPEPFKDTNIFTVSKNADINGFSDWRIPTYDELMGITYCGVFQDKSQFYCDSNTYVSPTIHDGVFPDFSNEGEVCYWSSTLYLTRGGSNDTTANYSSYTQYLKYREQPENIDASPLLVCFENGTRGIQFKPGTSRGYLILVREM